MKFLNIFKNKEVRCESCQKIFPENQLNQYDSTIRDEIEDGIIKHLCRNCLKLELQTYLRGYKGKAVMVYPLQKYNGLAYHFYPFGEMQEYEWTSDQIEKLRKYLPLEDTQCEKCKVRKAQINWCSPEIYNFNPFLEKINEQGHFEQKKLCPQCWVLEFIKKIEEENIVFNIEFLPPYNSDGFGTSFEA
ncbi:MAG: hypothetical protein HYS98_03010 [Deltaproteobacteria bacterium]|nr:hypothetical protein [Deltaproteobacteria bacterium]